jgi:hypothetical protein
VRGEQPHPPLQAAGYIAHRDFTPIECLPDDCLLKHYPVDLPWKNGMPASALVTSSEPADTKKSRMNLPNSSSARRRQAGARRPDRRRQVRLHVPGADPAHARACLVAIADLSPAARANLARVGWKPAHQAGSSTPRSRRRTHVGDDWQALVRHRPST